MDFNGIFLMVNLYLIYILDYIFEF